MRQVTQNLFYDTTAAVILFMHGKHDIFMYITQTGLTQSPHIAVQGKISKLECFQAGSQCHVIIITDASLTSLQLRTAKLSR